MSRSNNQTVRTSAIARAMAAACLIALGAAGGCGAKISPEQKAAMTKIQDLGGNVNFKNGGYTVDLTKTPVEDKDLADLKAFSNLKILRLQGTQITDEGLVHLQSIGSLEFINLERTIATRAGVESLKKALPNADVKF
jgi:hypothetical protein